MKNVYHDTEIKNDTLESVQDIDPAPQFRKPEAPPRKRRVEYDEYGRIRKDYSWKWVKIAGLVIAIVLVNLYVFHFCGADLMQIF